MATKNLSDVLFEQKSKRKKFIKLFVELVSVGEEFIPLIEEHQRNLSESEKKSSKALIEHWKSILREIVFLSIGSKSKK